MADWLDQYPMDEGGGAAAVSDAPAGWLDKYPVEDDQPQQSANPEVERRTANRQLAQDTYSQRWGDSGPVVKNVLAAAIGAGRSVLAPAIRPFSSETADQFNYIADAAEREAGGGVVAKGLRSFASSLPSMVVAGHAAGPYGAIGAGMIQEADQAYTASQDAGMTPGKAAGYAAGQGLIEGGIAAVFQRFGMGAFEDVVGRSGKQAVVRGAWNVAKDIAKKMGWELGEEELTEVSHKIAEKASGVDPEKWTWAELGDVVATTAVATVASMGTVEGASRLAQGQERAGRLADLKQQRSDQQTADVFNTAAWSTEPYAKSAVDHLLKNGLPLEQVRELATNPTSSAFEQLNLGSRKNRTMPTADARRAFGENALKYLESIDATDQEAAAGSEVSAPVGEAAQPGQPAGSEAQPANPDDIVTAGVEPTAQVGQPSPLAPRTGRQYQMDAAGTPAVPVTDLLGQPIEPAKPQPQAAEATPPPKQEMNAFDDVGVPDDMVVKQPQSSPSESLGKSDVSDAGGLDAETKAETSPIGRSKSWPVISKFQAAQWDMTPEEYTSFANQVWEEQGRYLSDIDAARKHAQQATKLYPSDVKRIESSGQDYTSIPNFDVLASEIANSYPALGWQHLANESSSRLEDKVWDLLKQGQQKIPSKYSPEYHAAVDEHLGGLLRSVSFNTDEFDNVREQEDEAERTARRDYAWGFFGGGSGRARNHSIPPQVKAPNPDVERQLDAAYGIPKQTLMQRLGNLVKAAVQSGRSQFHVPSDAKHATMNEMFRLLKQQPTSAQDEASRNIAAITGPLAEPQLQLFTRKVIADNLLASIDRGEPLRFGFKDRGEVAAYKDQLDRLAAGSPEVQQALQNRRRIVDALYTKLRTLDLLPDMTPDQVENYYHQQVLQYQTLPGHSRNPQITKRGFQRGRTKGEELGEDQNYNTSYLEAEYEWMRDAYTQTAKEQWLQDLGKRFDTLPKVKAQAKQAGTDWQSDLRNSKTHRLWQATPGNTFYRAIGVPEKVVADVLAGIAQTADVDASQLRDVLAVGGPQRQMALPNELVDQLDSMKAPQASGMAATVAKETLNSWKVWTLFSPLRAVAYNLRNITGDLDPVIGGNLASLAYGNRALKDMGAYFGIVGQQKLNLTPDMQKARDLGVIDATLTASEIPDIKDLEIFRRFFAGNKADIARLATGYFNTVKKFSAFRESLARYAAFLSYRDALNKGTLAHYGGARKEVVDQIHRELGVDAAAAHLSRNLLGDYGDLSVAGDFMRKHVMPFFSWQEVNFKRWPMMAVNAAAYGPRKFGQNPVAATAASAGAIGMLAVPFILFHLFNRLRYPDEEEELSDAERASPHIIWGRNADGSIRILRNTGALGDFLENFGIETALARLDELQAGQMTPQEVAAEMMKGVAAKEINSLRPDIKGAGEAIAGKSLYPDPFNPRTMDRSEVLAGNLGLKDVVAEVRGRVTKSGERARPNFLARTLGVTDPKQEAFFQIVELRDRFLGKLEDKGSFPANPYFNAMRQAALADDQQAFDEGKAAYLKDGGTYKKLVERLKNLGPLDRMSAENKAEFINTYLTADQKKKLQKATDYGEELRVKMWKMMQSQDSRG